MDTTSPDRISGRFLRPSIVTILGSYRCNAECEHCCFESNPRIKHRLSLAEITEFIADAAKFRELQMVVFSGGECFLLGDDLGLAIEFSKRLSLRTRCVTNGYWAKSMVGGRERLRKLKEQGLDELNISTGDYHQKYVSEETVVNAAYLGVELGIENTLIVVEMKKGRVVTKQRMLERYPQLASMQNDKSPSFKVIESPWMPMSYREQIDQDPIYMLNRTNVHLRTGCSSLNTTLVLSPQKKVGFCCGLTRELIPELNEFIGNYSLEQVLEIAGRDFMKIWLLVDGPERILAWAASKNAEIDWENKYSHHCHACLALFDDPLVRQTINNHYQERVDDVLMRYSFSLKMQEAAHGRKPALSAAPQILSVPEVRVSSLVQPQPSS